MEEYSCIKYELKGGVAYITLNRPDVYMKSAKRDKNVRVVVLTGAGKAFCSGQDLKAIAGAENRSLRDSLDKRYNPIIKAMRSMPKPIIGKINGVAAGAGCSLALACDYTIASEYASFIEVFVNVGLVLDSGSSYFLPRLVGSARAFEMATMGTKVKAQQALDWGIINKVVSADELDKVTDEVAAYYENAPTKAIALMKQMINKSYHSDLNQMLEYEACCQEIAGSSNDYKEGVTAFNEKRKPNFTGN